MVDGQVRYMLTCVNIIMQLVRGDDWQLAAFSFLVCLESCLQKTTSTLQWSRGRADAAIYMHLASLS